MKCKRLLIILFILSVVVVFLARDEGIPVAKAYTDEMKRSYELENSRVVIFADSVDPSCSVLAENLFTVIAHYYPRTEKIIANSFEEMQARSNEEFFARIYVFRGDKNGVTIGFDHVEWADFAGYLNKYTGVTSFGPKVHIAALGDGSLLNEHLINYAGFNVEPSAVIDVKVSFLYDIWTLADALEPKEAYRLVDMRESGHRLHGFAVRYFSEDINDLVYRSLLPVQGLGELIPQNISEVDTTKPIFRQVFPTPSTPDSEKPSLFMGTTKQSDSSQSPNDISTLAYEREAQPVGNDFFTGPEWDEDYLSFIDMSLTSGVNGPIGEILDSLLQFLADKKGLGNAPQVGISKDFLNQVREEFRTFLPKLNSTVMAWFEHNTPWLVNQNGEQGVTPTGDRPKQFGSVESLLNSGDSISYGLLADGQPNAANNLLNSANQGEGANQLNQLWETIAGECARFVNDKSTQINNWINKGSYLNYSLDNFRVGFGDFTAFYFNFSIGFVPGVKIDNNTLVEVVNRTLFSATEFEDAFNYEDVLSAITIVPMINATLGISAFNSTDSSNGITDKLFLLLDVQTSFSGSGSFLMELMKVETGFKDVSFFNIKQWSFKFDFTASKPIPLTQLVLGACGTIVSTVAGMVDARLDAVITFKMGIEIVKRSAEPGQNETSTFMMTISIGASVELSLMGIITLKGGIDISIKFFQDFAADTPFETRFVITLWFEFKIDLYLWDWSDRESWDALSFALPSVNIPPPNQNALARDESSIQLLTSRNKPGITLVKDPSASPLKTDSDMDGLSNDFEAARGLNQNKADSDGEGLSDKFELDVSKTDPLIKDTDDDDLDDFNEVKVYFSDPLRTDSDYDGIIDGDEVKIYGTSPINWDTDKDRLSDGYEKEHQYDPEGKYDSAVSPEMKSTLTVTSVMIGGQPCTYHTDPLNPDTDGDGLLDGEEGVRTGVYYGSDPSGLDSKMFNFGYTHPLDYDTDDDSYRQYCIARVDPANRKYGTVVDPPEFLRDMNDGIEVKGQLVVMVNQTTGGPDPRVVCTNPCNPDTDNDTAGAIYLNSDGRELSLNPPTDPTNGDSDSDGLLDGEEGTSDQFVSYHTNPNNWDTDNDKLADGEELKRGLNPFNGDSDGDQVSDGDEVFKYHTDPFYNDTDGDLLLDGEELFQFYSDPFVRDSDNDTIIDGNEAHVFGTDPINPDSDGDHLNDNIELFILKTDPLETDTDKDGTSDWDEVNAYNTNPLSWDTDGDSMTAINRNTGQMTLKLGDYEEIFTYHTNPLLSDTDGDGLTDDVELFLAQGVGGYTMFLNPCRNDTDGDGLQDGQELNMNSNKLLTMLAEGDAFEAYASHGAYTLCFQYNPTIAPTPQPVASPAPILSKDDYEYDDRMDLSNEISVTTELQTQHRSIEPAGDVDFINFTASPGIYTFYASSSVDTAACLYGLNQSEISGANLNQLAFDDDGNGKQQFRIVYNITESGLYFLKVAFCERYPYHTSPVNPDTDGDELLDGEEVYGDGVTSYHSNPNATDSDNDRLSDTEEVRVHHTDPANNDTDHDDLTDWDELMTYHTDPLEDDMDDDWLPDGGEIFYGTDLLKFDTDGDGTQDGMEFDYDNDTLKDGEEIYKYHTNQCVYTELEAHSGINLTDYVGHPWYVFFGGADNPDSDGDGLKDGDEVNIYHTSPTNSDTDGDGLSDGDEVNLYHTSPTSADSDGDGISDYDEIFPKGFSLTRDQYIIIILVAAVLLIAVAAVIVRRFRSKHSLKTRLSTKFYDPGFGGGICI